MEEVYINESNMRFGPFKTDELFEIEKSDILQNLGQGIKTVEFLIKREIYDGLLLIEAKSTCPNINNREVSPITKEKFEEYYSSITQKFEDSLLVIIALLSKRIPDSNNEMGFCISQLNLSTVEIKFILVIKTAEVDWLPAVKAELEERIRSYISIWKIKVEVLNEELARRKHLVK